MLCMCVQRRSEAESISCDFRVLFARMSWPINERLLPPLMCVRMHMCLYVCVLEANCHILDSSMHGLFSTDTCIPLVSLLNKTICRLMISQWCHLCDRMGTASKLKRIELYMQ